MQEMDGFEFVSEVQRNQRWKNIPIIVMTAKTLNKDELAHLQSRVKDVLHKGDRTIDSLLAEVSEKIHLYAAPGPSTG